MEKTIYRVETDRLWVRIKILQWALAQILALRYHHNSPPNQKRKIKC
jgi:hypothetical protein